MGKILNGVLAGKRFFINEKGELDECKNIRSELVKNVENYSTEMAEYFTIKKKHSLKLRRNQGKLVDVGVGWTNFPSRGII